MVSEHAYYELMLTAKWFSFPVTLLCKFEGYNELCL